MLNAAEETRAQEAFERELMKTRDWKQALHAALVDLDGRRVFDGRIVSAEVPRPLLDKYRKAIAAVCERTGAGLSLTCSLGRAGPSSPEVKARGVIVGLLTDAGYTTRQIADGTGIGRSVVANCKMFRSSRPEWEAIIAKFSALIALHP